MTGIEERGSEEIPSNADKGYFEYLLGYEAEISGKWEDALKHYSNALLNDPSSAYLKTQVSSMLIKLERLPEALSRLEEVVKANPDYVPALMLLGELYNVQKKVDDAIRIFERVLKIEPDRNEAGIFLGVLYLSKGDTRKAQDFLDAVLKRDPENVMALYYAGTIKLERKDYDKAEELFRKITELRPFFDAAYLNIGLINEFRGDVRA
ncbi:MAG: tetratricopeptide repeat protein, partial [Nitrospirae bacterium]|nr:tetratricopeptide repeat protein [Nitrospirota bacterium]